jgi:hypothetical protein
VAVPAAHPAAQANRDLGKRRQSSVGCVA